MNPDSQQNNAIVFKQTYEVAEWWQQILVSGLYPPETELLEPAIKSKLNNILQPGMNFLDAGCGEGRFARHAETILNVKVVGIDISFDLIKGMAENSVVMRGDITQMPYKSETFDVVLCSMVLMLIEDIESAISELARVLKGSGCLLLAILHPCFEDWGVRSEFPFSSGKDYLSGKKRRAWSFPTSENCSVSLVYTHRSLSEYINILAKFFQIKNLEELSIENCNEEYKIGKKKYANVEYLIIEAIKLEDQS